jgi:hypothetical protein
LLAGVFGVGPAAADTPLVIVNDNPAAPKIGMALLRCEACFTRDISILPDKRGHSIQQVMPPRGDATGAVSKISGMIHKTKAVEFGATWNSGDADLVTSFFERRLPCVSWT